MGMGMGHGQEHEQVMNFAESSTCASVAITSDPSRVSCLTSRTDTILTTTTTTTTTDEYRSEHEAFDPITQIV